MKYPSFLFLLFLWNITVAQTEKKSSSQIQMGETYSSIAASYPKFFKVGNDIISLKFAGKNLTLQKSDAETLKILGTEEVRNFPPNDAYLEKIHLFNDRIFIFYTLRNKGGGERLYCREVDIKNTTLKRQEVVFQTDGEITGNSTSSAFFSHWASDKYDFYTAKDKSKLLIQYKLKPAKKRDPDQQDMLGLVVLDQNMEKLWNNEIEMPYTQKELKIFDYGIDSKGNAFIIAAVTKKDEGSWLELLRIPANSKEVQAGPIELTGISITDIGLHESADETMKCVGVYSDLDKSGKSGIFTFNAHISGDVSDMKKHVITEQIVKQYMGEKALKKLEKREIDNDRDGRKTEYKLENLVIREVIRQDDGNSLIIAERIKEVTGDNGNAYFYKDILVSKITKNNELVWMRKLPKNQVNNILFHTMSYKYIKSGGKHVFLYPDLQENIDIKETDAPEQLGILALKRKGHLIAARIDEGGNVEKESVLQLKGNALGEALYHVIPSNFIQSADDEIVFEAYIRGLKQVLIKLKLN